MDRPNFEKNRFCGDYEIYDCLNYRLFSDSLSRTDVKLRVIRSVQVEGEKEAHELEKLLHKQFNELRLAGERFKAEPLLLRYINQL